MCSRGHRGGSRIGRRTAFYYYMASGDMTCMLIIHRLGRIMIPLIFIVKHIFNRNEEHEIHLDKRRSSAIWLKHFRV